jgi:predicted transcriptional regulator
MNRCRHDVILDVLSSLIIEPKRITEVCTAGNLPVDRGKLLVKGLEKFGLLIQTEENRERVFKLTNRGYEWIGLYKLMRKVLP